MHRIRSSLTYSNVMVTVLALVVLGGGTAYAAAHLGKESVGARQLKKGAVTTATVDDVDIVAVQVQETVGTFE